MVRSQGSETIGPFQVANHSSSRSGSCVTSGPCWSGGARSKVTASSASGAMAPTESFKQIACAKASRRSQIARSSLPIALTATRSEQQVVATAENPTAIAKFSCHGGKTVSPTFYSNSVELKLSDGRRLKVPQTLSGSGARYANSDETFVFWNKGDTAFITGGNGK